MSQKITTFFFGKTTDGERWVLSYEGGPTALNPEARCLVTGNLPSPVGRLKVRGLTIHQGSELRAFLPHLSSEEIPETLHRIRGRS